VAPRDALAAVRDEQDRAVGRDVHRVVDDLPGGLLVEVRRRLVEDEDGA